MERLLHVQHLSLNFLWGGVDDILSLTAYYFYVEMLVYSDYILSMMKRLSEQVELDMFAKTQCYFLISSINNQHGFHVCLINNAYFVQIKQYKLK